MSKIKLFALGLLTFAFIFTSCKKDDDDDVVINESQVLVEYLESTSSPAGNDFVNTDMPTIIAASNVKLLNETDKVYIIDIRAASDFDTAHIAKAHNVALGDILTHIKSVDLNIYDKVAIVCYTGQTAGFAASLLRLMGYDKVYSMKWGMCAWHKDFAGKWNTAISNGNAYAAQFVTTDTPKNAAGTLPVLSTGKTTGQEILEARVNAVLAEGFTPASVTNATVFGALSNYYIVNYWPAAQYADPGHVPGACQYTPKETMKYSTDLTTLPTDKTVVVYCYTGQTSAFLTAYLRLLGYDAKSLLFGTNGMIYDKMGEYNADPAHSTTKMSMFSEESEIEGEGYAYEHINP